VSAARATFSTASRLPERHGRHRQARSTRSAPRRPKCAPTRSSSTPPTARRRFAAPYEQLGEVDNALADGKAATPADDAAIQALVKHAETKIARRTEE
jgi:hypothetical protein